MGKLHALLAVERPLKATAKTLMAEAMETFGGKANRFLGGTKVIEYFDTTRQVENTTDTTAVVTTVDEKLDFLLPELAKEWDCGYQKDISNQKATANLILDGKVLITSAPATFLLSLEGKLVALRDIVAAIPTLDPTYVWTDSAESQRKGVYRSNANTTQRTEKRPDVQTWLRQRTSIRRRSRKS